MPGDALQRRLYLIARFKNQHKCDVNSCRKTARCSLLFPNPQHDSPEPVLRQGKRRYQYHSPRQCDKWTVSFLPDIALLLDAHSNIVKIVREEWSSYLLKYAAKPSPCGDLHLRVHDLFLLGCNHVDVYQQAVASRCEPCTHDSTHPFVIVAFPDDSLP